MKRSAIKRRSWLRRSSEPMKRGRNMRARREMVPVGYNEAGDVVIIFRSDKQASASGMPWNEVKREEAVFQIRMVVFHRAEGRCQKCGKRCIWEVGHMHEQVARGNGGCVSIENSRWLCPGCHIFGKDAAHANRRLHWGEKAGNA